MIEFHKCRCDNGDGTFTDVLCICPIGHDHTDRDMEGDE